MSKSKKNTIDPEEIIENYGADSVRLFILSDSPPEKDVQWSNEGIKSSFKFVQKLWVLNQKIIEEINTNHPKTDGEGLKKITNRFIENVENNIENFSYNKIVANIHETYAAINKIIKNKIDKDTWIENYKNILITMSPIIPHFSSECLANLETKNIDGSIFWPKVNKNILIEDKINFVIQINGKKRAILNIKKGLDEKELLQIVNEDKKLQNYIKDKTIKNTIFIPNKLVNIIIKN